MQVPADEPALIARIIALARRFGRYGYRRITALLRAEGWRVNHKRVERLWRQEGLRVPRKAPRRRRLWAADGSCRRRRAERPNHVWSYDFVSERTHDGRPLRLLTIVDEYTRECLSIDVARRLRSDDVLARLTALFVQRGPPTYVRSDNGPEFTATAVRSWLRRLGVTTLFIEPGSPWENGYVESFNGKLRDECLNPEIFTTLTEAQILVDRWRRSTTKSAFSPRISRACPASSSTAISVSRRRRPGTWRTVSAWPSRTRTAFSRARSRWMRRSSAARNGTSTPVSG